MKWGLLGGTFDPIHLGHLRCAEEVRELFDLDTIIFIPAAQQPLKTGYQATPFFHREQMVKIAINGNPSFAVSDIENERGGTSYSIDTVRHFLSTTAEKPDLYFILGQDAFHDIRKWKDWKDLLALCNFIVMTRPGYEVKGLAQTLSEDCAAAYRYDRETDSFSGPTGTSIYFPRLTFLEISSTGIRKTIGDGKSFRYLVPASVHSYILEHSLYRDRPL